VGLQWEAPIPRRFRESALVDADFLYLETELAESSMEFGGPDGVRIAGICPEGHCRDAQRACGALSLDQYHIDEHQPAQEQLDASIAKDGDKPAHGHPLPNV
jgi:hypothetical protein